MSHKTRGDMLWGEDASGETQAPLPFLDNTDGGKQYYMQRYNYMRDFFINLYINRFDYRDAPVSFNAHLMEQSFINGYAGVAVGFVNGALRVLGYVNGKGQDNLQQIRPTLTTGLVSATPEFYDFGLDDEDLKKLEPIDPADPTKGDYVIVVNKDASLYGLSTLTDMQTIEMFAGDIANIDRLSLLNRNYFKSTMMVEGGAGTIDAMMAWMEWNSGIQVIEHTKDYDPASMSAFTPNVPDFQVTLQTARNNKFGEFLTTFGINNPAIDKRERVLKAEAESNNALISLASRIYLNPRRRAFELLNKRFENELEKPIDVQFAFTDMVATTGTNEEINNIGNKQVSDNNGGEADV